MDKAKHIDRLKDLVIVLLFVSALLLLYRAVFYETPSPFTHCEEGGRIHFRENPYSFPPPTATPAMMNLLRKR